MQPKTTNTNTSIIQQSTSLNSKRTLNTAFYCPVNLITWKASKIQTNAKISFSSPDCWHFYSPYQRYWYVDVGEKFKYIKLKIVPFKYCFFYAVVCSRIEDSEHQSKNRRRLRAHERICRTRDCAMKLEKRLYKIRANKVIHCRDRNKYSPLHSSGESEATIHSYFLDLADRLLRHKYNLQLRSMFLIIQLFQKMWI